MGILIDQLEDFTGLSNSSKKVTVYKKLTGKSLSIRELSHASLGNFWTPSQIWIISWLGFIGVAPPCNCLITCDDRAPLNLRARVFPPFSPVSAVRPCKQFRMPSRDGLLFIKRILVGEGDRFSKIVFHPCFQRWVYIILLIRMLFTPLFYFSCGTFSHWIEWSIYIFLIFVVFFLIVLFMQ